MKILNTELMSNPVNWITVTLMVFIGIIFLNIILSPWHIPQKNTEEIAANFQPFFQPMMQ